MKTTRRDKELFESQHYNRKLARPLTFPFSRSFSFSLNGGGFDTDAASYLALLSGDGVIVSELQASAINSFYVTGKSEGWYSDLKRMYLPIFGAAAPNAICLVSGTSGTFNGPMTHGSGFVTGNGTSTYFDVGATPSAMGITTGDAFLMRGIHTSPAGSLHSGFGVADDSTAASLAMLNFASTHASAGTTYFRHPTSASAVTLTGQGSEYRGIYIGSSTLTSARFLLRRRSGGTTVVSNTTLAATAIKDLSPYCMARRLSGGLNTPSPGSEFAWAFGTGMTEAQAGDFTAALETMWETCTGLTLY